MAFVVFTWVKNGFYFMMIILAILSVALYSICENKALALFAAILITQFTVLMYIFCNLWLVSTRTPGGLAAVDDKMIEETVTKTMKKG
jgi:hypothetical protein